MDIIAYDAGGTFYRVKTFFFYNAQNLFENKKTEAE